jgi:hypothetical protein
MVYVSVRFMDAMTPSVSGQNLCLGMPANMASAACRRSLMSATVRVGWPTVWPTARSGSGMGAPLRIERP